MNKYDSSKSQSYTPDGRRDELGYLDSTTSGFWSRDKITFGDIKLENHDFIESVSDGSNSNIILIFSCPWRKCDR